MHTADQPAPTPRTDAATAGVDFFVTDSGQRAYSATDYECLRDKMKKLERELYLSNKEREKQQYLAVTRRETLEAALECAVETARTSARNDNGTWFLKVHGTALLNALRELSAIREALTGEDYASLPSDIPTVRMAHDIRSDRDKFLQQVHDTCSRAEKAERELSAKTAETERMREALLYAAETFRQINEGKHDPFSFDLRSNMRSAAGLALEKTRAALAATRKEDSGG